MLPKNLLLSFPYISFFSHLACCWVLAVNPNYTRTYYILCRDFVYKMVLYIVPRRVDSNENGTEPEAFRNKNKTYEKRTTNVNIKFILMENPLKFISQFSYFPNFNQQKNNLRIKCVRVLPQSSHFMCELFNRLLMWCCIREKIFLFLRV